MQDFLKKLFTGQQYDEKNFFLIAGPCVVENETLIMEVAEKVFDICKRLAYSIYVQSLLSQGEPHQR